jgi:hypothetical protein
MNMMLELWFMVVANHTAEFLMPSYMFLPFYDAYYYPAIDIGEWPTMVLTWQVFLRYPT